MPDIIVTLPIEEYNRLLKIEASYNNSTVRLEMIDDEDISDALQMLFINRESPGRVKSITGIEITTIEHPIKIDSQGFTVKHRFKKLLIIKRYKKLTDEEDRSKNNS